MLNSELIRKFREDTPGCKNFNHMNNAGSALMPRPVIEAIKGHIDLEAEVGGYEAHADRLNEIYQVYVEAGAFLNCKPGNVAFVANATDAFARALSSIPFKRGDVILTSDDDYISNQIMYLSLQKRLGVRLERVPCTEEGGIDVSQVEGLIRRHRPKLVAVTHVPTNSGLVQDVVSIGKICEELGVIYLVDACQSVGQLPVDVQEMRCDFLSATMRKFLRGPRGAGFLYVSDKALSAGFEPLFLDMQGAEWTGANEYLSRTDATRFEDWEFAYALVLGSGAALKYANQIGIKDISQRSVSLAAALRTRLAEIEGFRVLDQGQELCAIVTSHIEIEDYTILKEYLKKRRINAGITAGNSATIDFARKGVDWALRLAPHYYNTEDEIDQVVTILENFLRRR